MLLDSNLELQNQFLTLSSRLRQHLRSFLHSALPHRFLPLVRLLLLHLTPIVAHSIHTATYPSSICINPSGKPKQHALPRPPKQTPSLLFFPGAKPGDMFTNTITYQNPIMIWLLCTKATDRKGLS